MPSTYSNLKIQLMATGENNTSWGDVTNVNLGTALEEAIVGSADVTFASANVTLTLTNTNASQTARNLRLRCTGTTGGSTRNLVVPSIEKPYIVQNDCADSIVIKTAAGTGVTVLAGATTWVYSDGVNVVSALSYTPSFSSVNVAAVNGVIGTLTSVDITTSNLTSTNLATTNLAVTNLLAGNATATNLNATTAILTNLTSTNATSTNLNATTAVLTNLTSTNATSTNLNATTAILTNLTSTNATATNLNATTAVLTNLTSTNATATNLNATTAVLTDLTATNLNATTAVLTNLTSTNATSTNLTATTVLDAGTIGAAAPGFRGLPQNAQTGAYTLALSDIGKQVSNTTGGWVIPANASVAFPIGAAVVLFNNSGSSQTVSITSDTLRLAGTATTGTRTVAQYGLVTCVKVASTTWVISGSGLS
jgi:hypothetical protein